MPPKPKSSTTESSKTPAEPFFKHKRFNKGDIFLGRRDSHDLYFHIHEGTGRVTLKARYDHGLNDYVSWGGPMPPPRDCKGWEILMVAHNIAMNKNLFSAVTCYNYALNMRGKVMLDEHK